MAGEKISIPVSQLRHVGSEFKAASHQSQEVLNRLRQTVNALEPQWEGLTKQRFYDQFRQWETTMRQFSQLLETVGANFERVAADAVETDRDLARDAQRIQQDR